MEIEGEGRVLDDFRVLVGRRDWELVFTVVRECRRGIGVVYVDVSLGRGRFERFVECLREIV